MTYYPGGTSTGTRTYVDIDLDPEALIKETKKECDRVSKIAAQKVLKDAKTYIAAHAKHPTGKLASEIKIEESHYEGGGWAVEAQGPRNYDRYYATFIELGGTIRTPTPIPFLRSPLNANRTYIKNLFKDLI